MNNRDVDTLRRSCDEGIFDREHVLQVQSKSPSASGNRNGLGGELAARGEMMIKAWKVVLCTIVCGAILAGSAAVAAPPASQTATQFYMTYRAAFDKATKIEDILPFMSADNRKQAESTPKDERDKMFGMIKMMDTNTKVKVLKEDRQPDGSVVLDVSAYDTDQKKDVGGKVTIVKEGGAWKLGKEAWSSSS